jgi:hypothetical protein
MARPGSRRRHQLIDAVRAGEGRALVVAGGAGVGKSALLDYVARHASGCRVARVVGVQSEMELAFAGLHQLCAPMLDRLDRLPGPRGDALRTAFGDSAGPAPEPAFQVTSWRDCRSSWLRGCARLMPGRCWTRC